MTSLHERLITISDFPPGRGDGRTPVTMPALHPDRTEQVDFVSYKAPPISCDSDKAALEEWIARASYIEDDLHWLLKLPHDRFWCQVVFDKSLHQCISSYLHYAPKPHDLDLDLELPLEVTQKSNSLLRLFFYVCLRMSTHKESKENHISPHVFGDILYENFIFDIPKIFDICALYGRSNEAIVSKMISNVFTQQKKYYDDLQHIVSTTVEIFDVVGADCGIAYDLSSSPKRLTDKVTHGKNRLISMNPDKFLEIILYLADIAFTLRSFVDVFPEGAASFIHENFPQRLAVLYETALTGFAAALKEREKLGMDRSSFQLLRRSLCLAKGCFLHIFHKVLFHSFLGPLLECTSAEEASEFAEGYMIVLTGILSEKRFLADLETLFPFDADKDILSQSAYRIDDTRLRYVEEAISEAVTAYGPKKSQENSKQADSLTSQTAGAESLQYKDEYQTETNEYDSYEELGACAPKISGIELESLVFSVKDIFPDLGEGFIELCLEEFNYDSEKVIGAIVENNLPPGLQTVDRSMKRRETSPETAASNGFAEDDLSLLNTRSNIFDGDEFDIFRNNVDISKVHIGKKERPTKTDKSELSKLKSFYQKYDIVVDTVEIADGEDYDDEYDDTYDSNLVGTIDDDSADELMSRRPIVTPRVFEKAESRSRVGESSSEDENFGDKPRANPDHFIEDPAKLRQMREERYAARAMNRRGRGGRQAPGVPQEVNRDVKGGPKGQGQSQEVLRNRAFKERNKDSRVHHNRKDLADRKRKF